MPRLGYSWGDTDAERTATYPCDRLIAEPHQTCHRAIDVDAPAPLVWRWLCQLRAAPYSYDWIDNRGRRSPRELTPGLDDLAVGQRAVVIFEVANFERDRSITLYAPHSIFGELALSYCVAPSAPDRSRITVRLIVRYPGKWRVMRHVPPIGDLVMMRKQLRTLKRYAERDYAARSTSA
ncbi:MAG: hypothetical protein EXQ79_07480 [Acidimicrobiia bacterium]|nr:hypothetical protein [Acidimicrobiia bacterium]